MRKLICILIASVFLLASCTETPKTGGSKNRLSAAVNAQYIRTGEIGESLMSRSLTLITSAEELTGYCEQNKDNFALGSHESVYADTTIGFADAVTWYDEKYFITGNIVIAVMPEASGSFRHEVTSVSADGVITISCDRTVVGTADEACWHIIIEVRKDTPASGYTLNEKPLSVSMTHRLLKSSTISAVR